MAHDVEIHPTPGGNPAAQGMCVGEAVKRALTEAFWTQYHWQLPTNCAINVIIDGKAVRVSFGPQGRPAVH